MKAPWPIVPLGQAIRHRKEFITIDDLAEYKRCRVQLHAKGIVLRDIVTGAAIRTKKQQVCRAGEFLVAEIDAKVGGFGIVPDDLDGAIVSSHYFLYEIDEQQLERHFLDYYVRTRSFRDQVEAQGSTNYAAIRPQHVLEYTIPLPPLAEQQRIVALLDALAARIEEAKGLRAQAVTEVEATCRAILFDNRNDLALTPMRRLVELRETDVSVEPDLLYQFAGVYSFGRGVFRSLSKLGSEFSYKRLTRLDPNDFVFPKLMAWEGAFGIVPAECVGYVVSPEFPVFRVNQQRVLPEVLDFYFKTPTVWPVVSGISTGTNVRRRRLNPTRFLDYDFPLPPMSIQHKLRQVTRQLEHVRRLLS